MNKRIEEFFNRETNLSDAVLLIFTFLLLLLVFSINSL
jgi:hypothetical protein